MRFLQKRHEDRARHVLKRVTSNRVKHENIPSKLLEQITGAHVVIVRSSEGPMTAFTSNSATKIGHTALDQHLQVQPVSSESACVDERVEASKGVGL